MAFLIRIITTAVAVLVATWLIDGIELGGDSTLKKVVTLLIVAAIFGVINAFIKPIIKSIGCLFYVLTLGLIALVVNALLFWLTSWVAGVLNLPFHVDGFWPAFWGAIIVSIVSWVLSLVLPDGKDD